MKTVNEAWGELELVVVGDDEDSSFDGAPKTRDAARSLALAVLEEVMDGVMKSQKFMDYYELRKQLEELGK